MDRPEQTAGEPPVIFDHAALATAANPPIRDFILDLFGGTVIWNDWAEHENAPFRGVQIDMGHVLLELIAPGTPESFLHPFLAKRGPGLHHLTWKASRIEPLVDRLVERGVPLTGVERRGDRIVNAFIRPAASFGVLTQFRPTDFQSDETRRTHPARINVPPPRTLLASFAGVGIAVPDGAAARFFHEVLGGEITGEEARNGALVQTLSAGGTRLEFHVPADPTSELSRFLTERGSGLHHLIFHLEQPDAVLAAASRLGLTVGERPDKAIWIDANNPSGAFLRLVR